MIARPPTVVWGFLSGWLFAYVCVRVLFVCRSLRGHTSVEALSRILVASHLHTYSQHKEKLLSPAVWVCRVGEHKGNGYQVPSALLLLVDTRLGVGSRPVR